MHLTPYTKVLEEISCSRRREQEAVCKNTSLEGTVLLISRHTS